MRICWGNQGQDGLENPLSGQGDCKTCLSPVSPEALRPRHDSEGIKRIISITGRSPSQSSDGKVSEGLPLSEAAHLSSSQCSTPSVVESCRQRLSTSSASSVALRLRWCGSSRAITRLSPGRRPEQLPGQLIFACPSWSCAAHVMEGGIGSFQAHFNVATPMQGCLSAAGCDSWEQHFLSSQNFCICTISIIIIMQQLA